MGMNGRKIGLGSPELTKLWGKSESNLDACKTPKRQFIPTVEEYFEEAIMHSDPKNEIEDSFKCYLDPSYGWRSLRLLAHSSPLFFSLQPTTMHHLPVPKYLEHIFKRLRKETKKDETEQVEVDSKGDNEFENEKEETTAPGTPVRDEKTGLLTNDQVDDLAMQLEDKWEDLANELRHIKSEDIKSIKKRRRRQHHPRADSDHHVARQERGRGDQGDHGRDTDRDWLRGDRWRRLRRGKNGGIDLF